MHSDTHPYHCTVLEAASPGTSQILLHPTSSHSTALCSHTWTITYSRMLFTDFSLVFSIVIPSKLINQLTDLAIQLRKPPPHVSVCRNMKIFYIWYLVKYRIQSLFFNLITFDIKIFNEKKKKKQPWWSTEQKKNFIFRRKSFWNFTSVK